jgi:hypothetical protein
MAQTLYPTAIVAKGGLEGVVSDIDDDPASPDGNWCTSGSVSTYSGSGAGALTLAGQGVGVSIPSGDADATVTWTAPTTNNAGQSFDNSTNDRTIASYRIYYGTNQQQVLFGSSAVINGATSPYEFTGLSTGTWYFRVVAVDGDGDESANWTTYSKVVS